MESVTRRELRDVASGNITIEDILNRARFDESFQKSKFAVLFQDDLDSKPLCYHFTWESGICLYGNRCRYAHNQDMVLRSLGDVPICQKGPIVSMKRRPLDWLLNGWLQDSLNIHKTVYIEFQGRIVWSRDSGKKSAELWEKCQNNISSRRAQLRAIASSVGGLDTVSQTSVPESVELLEQLLEDNFERVFSFLDIQDIVELFIAFVSNSFVRDELRTCLLSPYVWEAVVASKWSLGFNHIGKPITYFLKLKAATLEAHTALVSSSFGLYTHGNIGGFDSHPAKGRPALVELAPNSTPGKTILVSEDGNPVSDIRFTSSLIALGNGNEVSIFRSGDLVKVGSCKQKSACELVTLPTTREENIFIHAGSSGMYLRDLDEPNLKVKRKISIPSDHRLVSLEATNHSVFLGSTKGLGRINSESGQLVSEITSPHLIQSRMWSEDGRVHVCLSTGSVVSLFDFRMKTANTVTVLQDPSICLATNGWGNHAISVGGLSGAKLIDLRSSVIWSVASPVPTHHVTLTDRTVCLYQTSENQSFTNVSSYSTEAVLLGSHSIPFKVSTVGVSTDGGLRDIGCAYAIKRQKRSGRGDNGILCLGGPAFIARTKSVRCSRRGSRDAFV